MSGGARNVCTHVLLVLASTLLASCERSQGGSTAGAPAQPCPRSGAIAAVPLGDLAGAPESTLANTIVNPYEGNAQAVQQGHTLFVRMNCAGCHGYDAKGGMGPNLTDTYWRYGGTPAAIFKSIYEGRPQGMPAWNPTLPPEEIWKLVAYVESLGGTFTPAQYQASVQGDRVGENVAPEVTDTLAGTTPTPAQRKDKGGDSAPANEARPDAGGTPPGSKP